MFVSQTTQPEFVNLSGSLHLVIKVAGPQPPPIEPVPFTVHNNLQGVSGIGQTTGLTYHATGASTSQGMTTLPGSFSIQAAFQLIPPTPIRIAAPNPPPILPVSGFVTLSANGTPTQATATSSLVSWWQAEGNANDAEGNNPGTLVGNVTFDSGKIGEAFDFSGGGYIEVPQSMSLEPQTLTAMAWVNSSFPNPGQDAYVLSRGAKGCNAASYAIYAGGSGGLFFYVFDGGTFVLSPDAGTGIWDGNWHHVAGTYDGSFVRLYVDGTEVGPGTPSTISINYALSDNQNFYIGTYKSSTCTLGFVGDVDEVQIYSRSLSASEIQAIYNATQ